MPHVPAWLMFVALAACIGAILIGGYLDDGSKGTTRRKHIVNVAYLVVAVTGLTFFVGTIQGVGDMLTADVRAVNTLEKRYDVTIDDYTRYSERPSQWRIDGIWRECYLSDSTYAHADKALLICDMVDPEKPKYAELGTTPSTDPSADPTPTIIVD